MLNILTAEEYSALKCAFNCNSIEVIELPSEILKVLQSNDITSVTTSSGQVHIIEALTIE
ncbi:MAG: hypothetical protein ACI935_001655 [Moritella dasanensis]|jgi:hypothetical protein